MATSTPLPLASRQDGTHPRPQLLRAAPHGGWTDLGGTWQLGLVTEAAPAGRAASGSRWRSTDLTDRTGFEHDVVVPYPPESTASGVAEQGPFRELWYRRALRLRDLEGAVVDGEVLPGGSRLVLRFGAVDHSARVWFDGHLVAEHTGGQTPFSADVTELLLAGDGDGGGAVDPDAEHVVVVRAVDDARDPDLPRGKQDWLDEPHAIWYRRTSGIWQTVWAEVVPAVSIEHLAWRTDLTGAAVHLTVELSDGADAAGGGPTSLAVRLALAAGDAERELADVVIAVPASVAAGPQRVEVALAVPALHHGQDRENLLWSPRSPHLVDAQVRLLAGTPSAAGRELDAVASYVGLRTVQVHGGELLVNGSRQTLRSVLDQGYWPDTHLAASAERLKAEAELVADLGFDSVRIHQKVEDPRFLHWCDRLGITVWGETANAYAHTPRAVALLTAEWLEVVHRDVSHPCVVAWVPVNESWGVQDVATSPGQQAYQSGLAAITRALDPTRPVITNDGWEHTSSDLWTIHEYTDSGAVLRERYGSPAAVEALVAEPTATSRRTAGNGRLLRLSGSSGVSGVGGAERAQPLVLSEFGGVRFTPGSTAPEGTTWGYSTAADADDYARRLGDLLGAANDCLEARTLSGFCWTQLADTMQEANGLVTQDRTPKLPVAQVRALVTGGS